MLVAVGDVSIRVTDGRVHLFAWGFGLDAVADRNGTENVRRGSTSTPEFDPLIAREPPLPVYLAHSHDTPPHVPAEVRPELRGAWHGSGGTRLPPLVAVVLGSLKRKQSQLIAG
jgi:hypothetical protein